MNKREHLHQLVDAKNRWSRPLTVEEKRLGFLGWHERGYVPHCDYPGLTQFVTVRLWDSLPVSRRGKWEHLLEMEDAREKRAKLEEYLDRGVGACFFHDSQIAELAEQALLHFHSQTYELLAWCVMPNHVHVLVEVWQTPLWKLVQTWKRYIATRALKLLPPERRTPIRRVAAPKAPNRSSALPFWQREYWDTFMRHREQERKAIRYIENNPVKAGLCKIASEWNYNSARFREAETGKLVLKSFMPHDPAPS